MKRVLLTLNKYVNRFDSTFFFSTYFPIIHLHTTANSNFFLIYYVNAIKCKSLFILQKCFQQTRNS